MRNRLKSDYYLLEQAVVSIAVVWLGYFAALASSPFVESGSFVPLLLMPPVLGVSYGRWRQPKSSTTDCLFVLGFTVGLQILVTVALLAALMTRPMKMNTLPFISCILLMAAYLFHVCAYSGSRLYQLGNPGASSTPCRPHSTLKIALIFLAACVLVVVFAVMYTM